MGLYLSWEAQSRAHPETIIFPQGAVTCNHDRVQRVSQWHIIWVFWPLFPCCCVPTSAPSSYSNNSSNEGKWYPAVCLFVASYRSNALQNEHGDMSYLVEQCTSSLYPCMHVVELLYFLPLHLKNCIYYIIFWVNLLVENYSGLDEQVFLLIAGCTFTLCPYVHCLHPKQKFRWNCL